MNTSTPKKDINKPTLISWLLLALFAWVFAPSTHHGQSLEEGLQAHWTFDETEGNKAMDSTDNNNHGDLFADPNGELPAWLPDGGRIGGALSFNGANYVEVPDAPSIGADLVQGFSISAWFKSNSPLITTGGSTRMLEKGNSFFFLQWPGGGMNFLVKRSGHNITAGIVDPIDAHRWYNITGVFDGEEIRVYLDGRLKGSAHIGTDVDDAGLPLRIGSDDSGNFFDGTMDDVRIWNRPLADEDIKVLCQVGITGPPKFLSQPDSQSRVFGDSVTFSVQVDGELPMTYQWFKDDDPITGATDSSLTLDDLTDANAASYTVVATNSEGSATSDAATLSVNAIKNPELLVHLPLDETNGHSAADISGNDLHGKLENFGSGGNANWIEGHVEGGLKLAGDHVAVSGLPETTSTTWAVWVRLDKAASYSTAISAAFPDAGAGHTLGFAAGDSMKKPRVLWNHAKGHTSLISPDPVEVGEWNHIAITMDVDTSTLILYVNGKEKGRSEKAKTSAYTTLNLGRREADKHGKCPMEGSLDHVAVYNRALSSGEISQLVDKESVAEGLLVLWNMNETAGLKLADTSGKGHDGVCSENQSSFWVSGKKDGGLDFTPKSYMSVSGLPEVISTTWSVWVNLQSKPSYVAAISATFEGAGAGHSLGFPSGATALNPRVLWNHAAGHTSIMSPDPVKLNEWVHMATTYDGETQELVLYVNGEEKASGTAKTTPFTSINLGQRESSKNCWIDAILDDARVYAKVLEPEEIEELYGRRVTGPPQITSHPQSRTHYSGEETVFSVAADGLEPIGFQWFKDGEAIEGEDWDTLELEELTADDEGIYHVVATNSEGSATSDKATLEVTVLATETFGLVAQYDFEETSGMVANDSSGNEVHGKLMAFPDGDDHWVEGRFGIGKALRIKKPQYVEVTLPKAMTTFSFTAWVMPESKEDWQTIIGADFKGAAAGHIFGSRTLKGLFHPRVLWNHGGAHAQFTHNAPTELGEWVHMAMTYDWDTKKLNFYVDGDVANEMSSESNPFLLVNIGRRVPTKNCWFTGVVDDIRIHDVVLSAQEIAAQAKRPPKVLEILSLSLAEGDQLDLVLKSPMPEREHVVQRKSSLGDETWIDLSDVSFSEPDGRVITATFNRSVDPASFYRAGVVLPKAIFFEDFESGAEGWEHGGTEDNWELGKPVNGPGSAYSGENVYATGLNSDYAPGTESFLLSPEIDLTGVDSATLVFQEFRDVDPNPIFHKTVVNVLDADTLEFIEELSNRSGSTSQWKEVSLPLSQDSLNRKIRLEFRLTSDNINPRQGWYLDDITLLPE